MSKRKSRVKQMSWTIYLICVYFILYFYISNSEDQAHHQHVPNAVPSYNEFPKEIVINTNRTLLQTVRFTTQNRAKKNILLWNQMAMPFHLIYNETEYFTKNRYKCKHTNCYFTFDRNYLPDVRDFDAIVFSGCKLENMPHSQLPIKRSLKQKYVFATMEPAALYPISDPLYDNFFNWTWTHRLHSDILWRYISVYNLNGTLLGPAIDINWPKAMRPINEFTKSKLRSKTKAAAWLVSHCSTKGQREKFVERFNIESEKYGWRVDIIGQCGNITCPKYSEGCFKIIEKEYYFYLALENSLEEDYVSEKLLTATRYFAVPVVYGGADYSRFLPPGSYLDARKLGPALLAKVMNEAIRNKTLYYNFFRWRNHLRYESPDNSTDICNICTALNNEEMMNKISVYKDFRSWWNGPKRRRLFDFMLKTFLLDDAIMEFASRYNYTQESKLALMRLVQNQTNSRTVGMKIMNYVKAY